MCSEVIRMNLHNKGDMALLSLSIPLIRLLLREGQWLLQVSAEGRPYVSFIFAARCRHTARTSLKKTKTCRPHECWSTSREPRGKYVWVLIETDRGSTLQSCPLLDWQGLSACSRLIVREFDVCASNVKKHFRLRWLDCYLFFISLQISEPHSARITDHKRQG